MHYTIYKITNKINGKTYIGKHQTKNLNDGYFGSGKLLQYAVQKYGKENFLREILFDFVTDDEMNAKEKELVVVSEQTYNLCEGGKGGFGYINQNGLNAGKSYFTSLCREDHEKIWKKGIEVQKNKKKDPTYLCELNHKISESMKGLKNFQGKNHTEITIQKMKASHKGKHTGLMNSQYGTCWVSNHLQTIRIKKQHLNEWLAKGFRKGRKIS